jgi:MFS family permease
MSNTRGRRTARTLLRKRDFRLLLTAVTISSAGDYLYSVALVVYVYNKTGSASWVGATSFAKLLPYILFGAIGGVIADRYEKRATMAVSDLARASIMFLMAILASRSGPAVLILILAFVATTAGTPFRPAFGALLPKVCREDELTLANSLTSTVEHVALIAGPAIGALLLLLGSAASAFALNGLTFLASAAATWRMGVRAERSTDQAAPTIATRLAEGVSGLRASSAASLLVLLLLAMTGLYGFEVVFTVLVAERSLMIGSEGVGWLTAATGLGGVAAAIFANRIASSKRSDIILLTSIALMGLPLAALATTNVVFVALLLMALTGGGNILFDVVVMTTLQRVVPEHLLARVFGIIDALAVASMLLGSLLAPLLFRVVGLSNALMLVGIAVPTACLLAAPRLRSLGEAADQTKVSLEPLVALFRRSGAFEGAPPSTLESLARATVRREVSAGDILIQEGDLAEDFFIIEEGTFDVTSLGETAVSPIKINELHSTDYFGEIGLLEQLARTATVTAQTDGVVVCIKGSEFLDLARRGSGLSPTLVSSVAGRLRITHPTLAL